MNQISALKRRAAALGVDLKKLETVIESFGFDTANEAITNLERQRKQSKELGGGMSVAYKGAEGYRGGSTTSSKMLTELQQRASAVGIHAARFDSGMEVMDYADMLKAVENLEAQQRKQAAKSKATTTTAITPAPPKTDPFTGLRTGGKTVTELQREAEAYVAAIEFVYGRPKTKEATKPGIDPFTHLPIDGK